MVQQNNESCTSFVGIDISKATLDINIGGSTFKIANKKTPVRAFVSKYLAGKPVKLTVVEATGPYTEMLVDVLHEYSVPVHRAHPNKVHAFATVSNHFAKTDKLDAQLLCKFAKFVYENQDEKGDEPLDENIRSLSELRQLARTNEDNIHATQCRIKTTQNKSCLAMLKKQLKMYTDQVENLELMMQEIIKTSPELQRKVKIMQTMCGVALKSAMKLLAELPELGTISKRKIACLVGVAPKTYESGTKVGAGHICGGRFYARKSLYMCALVASKHCPVMSKKYQSLLARGKPKKVALVAIMRKLVVCLNAMVRDMQEFRYEA